MIDDELSTVYRILDANINRLREALRVVEEYCRFDRGATELAVRLKKMRHGLQNIEVGLDPALLLRYRDTDTDPFASETRPEERNRNGIRSVMTANLKRAQEAARVIEEYGKLAANGTALETAKKLRFELYDLEKHLGEKPANG